MSLGNGITFFKLVPWVRDELEKTHPAIHHTLVLFQPKDAQKFNFGNRLVF